MIAILGAPGVGAADELRAWHAGLALRSDLGTHAARLAGGIRLAQWDFTLIVDPLVAIDDVHDLDALVERALGTSRWAALAGVRVSSIGLDGGRRWQDKLVLGVTAALPPLGPLRGRFGLELATLVVAHGGGTGTAWLDGGRTWIDAFQLGLFARMELERAW